MLALLSGKLDLERKGLGHVHDRGKAVMKSGSAVAADCANRYGSRDTREVSDPVSFMFLAKVPNTWGTAMPRMTFRRWRERSR
jgi:hypothetical protein